jgi:hypothetical protein
MLGNTMYRLSPKQQASIVSGLLKYGNVVISEGKE